MIKIANEKRNKASDAAEDKNRIVITQAWMSELTAHPYYSRKSLSLILFRETGIGVHLLKERAKLQRDHAPKKTYTIGKRLMSQVVN